MRLIHAHNATQSHFNSSTVLNKFSSNLHYIDAMTIDPVALASIESFHSIAFNAACLYAASILIFGLLSLNSINTEREKRQGQWRQFYGGSETAKILLAKQKAGINTKPGDPIAEPNRFTQGLEFLYYFFIRPSVIVGILFASIVLRNWKNSLISEVLSFGFSAMVVSKWSDYSTKFIPFMCIAIGIAYGTMHLAAAQNDWFGFELLGSSFKP